MFNSISRIIEVNEISCQWKSVGIARILNVEDLFVNFFVRNRTIIGVHLGKYASGQSGIFFEAAYL
jgi:hypothetical protein